MFCQSITEPSGFGQTSNIMNPVVQGEVILLLSPTQWVWHPYCGDHGTRFGEKSSISEASESAYHGTQRARGEELNYGIQ